MQRALHAFEELEVHLRQVVVEHQRRDARLVHLEREHDQVEHQLHVIRHVLRQLVRRARHVGLRQRRPPAFEALFLRGALDALLDVADRFEVLVQLDVVAAADLRLQALRVLPHLVEDAAVERAARAVADQAVEGARRDRSPWSPAWSARPTTGSSRRSSTGRLRAAARSARCRAPGWGSPSGCRSATAMTWSIDVPTRISFGSRLTVAPDSRFMRPRCGLVETRRGLVEQPADEDHVLAMRQHRRAGRARAPSSAPLPLAHQWIGSTPFEKKTMPSRSGGVFGLRPRRPRPGRRPAATPSRAAPARRRRRAGNDAATRDGSSDRRMRHRLRLARVDGTSRRRDVVVARAIAELRLVTIFTARSENDGVAAGRRHLVDERPIGRQHGPAQRVAEHLPRQRRHHLLVLRLQVVSRPSAPTIVVLSRELAGDVDRLAVGIRLRAARPTASKPSSGKPSGSMRRWHAAHVALRLCSASRSPQRQAVEALVVGRERAGVGRRRRRRRAENAAQHPVAALHRARAQRRRRRRQHRAEAQRAAAVERVARRRPSPPCPVDGTSFVDAVELRQRLVQERVVGVRGFPSPAGPRGRCTRRSRRPRRTSPSCTSSVNSGKRPVSTPRYSSK